MAAKRKSPSADTTAELARAGADLAAIRERILEANAARDSALLDEDPVAIAAAEKTLAELAKDVERAVRRIALLQERAAAELSAAQKKAQAELIDRVTAKLADRDAAGADLVEHLAGAVKAFRNIITINNGVAASWPFDFGSINAAMLNRSFVTAVEGELYRLSGDIPGAPAFPGARCPDIADTRTSTIKPLTAQLAAASKCAIETMHNAPIRALAAPVPLPTPAPHGPASPIVPAATTQVSAANVPLAAPAAEAAAGPAPQFRWNVDFVHAETGARKSVTVDFDAQNMREASLDGLGGTGPCAMELAIRLASAKVPEGFAYAGDGGSRFDLKHMMASMGEAA